MIDPGVFGILDEITSYTWKEESVPIPAVPPEPPVDAPPLLKKLIRYGCPNCAQKLHASQWTRVESDRIWVCSNCRVSHTDEFIDTFGGNDFEHAFYESQARVKTLKAEVALLEAKMKSDARYRQLETDLAHVKRQLSQKHIYESVVAGVVLLGKLIDDAASTTDPETFDFKVGQLLTRLIEFSRDSPYNESAAAPLRPILKELEGWELEAIEVSDLVDHALNLDDLEDHNPEPFPEKPAKIQEELNKAMLNHGMITKEEAIKQLGSIFPGAETFNVPKIQEKLQEVSMGSHYVGGQAVWTGPSYIVYQVITGLDFESAANGVKWIKPPKVTPDMTHPNGWTPEDFFLNGWTPDDFDIS